MCCDGVGSRKGIVMDSSGNISLGGALGAALGHLLSEKDPGIAAQVGDQSALASAPLAPPAPPAPATPQPTQSPTSPATEQSGDADVVVTRKILDEPLPGAGWQPSAPSISEDSTAETGRSGAPAAEVTVTPAPSLIEEPVTQPALPEDAVEVPVVDEAVPGSMGPGSAGAEALAQAADVAGGLSGVESAPSEDGSRVDDLKSRIEETRRRIRRELEQPFDASVTTKPLGGDWTSAPVVPETPLAPPGPAPIAESAPAAAPTAPEAPVEEVAAATPEAPVAEEPLAVESPTLETVEVEMLPAEPVEIEPVAAEPVVAETPVTEPEAAEPFATEAPAMTPRSTAQPMEYEASVIAETPLAPPGPAPIAESAPAAAPTAPEAPVEEVAAATPEAPVTPEVPAGPTTPAPPETPASEAVETPEAPVAEEPAVPEVPAARESAETTPIDLSGTVSDGDLTAEAAAAEEPVDYDSMKDRIESTRSRLKAKAFDAMMTGEAALLGRDLDGDTRPASDALEVDSDIDQTIETSLQEEED